MEILGLSIGVVLIGGFIILVGLLTMLARFYKKVEQGHALVRNGVGGTSVTFSGIMVIPILHRMEFIDISVKKVTIDRQGIEGLICQDNLRADIKVAFFVRVNKTGEDVLKVAQSIGCERASHQAALQDLFEAKFSEALKTVGKQFDFVDLYNSREKFKEEMLKIIGTDLNGFILDDAAIDFLEQTQLEDLKADNILDSQGIKKITELTATQKILANQIDREKEKTITKQDVEARETVLELNRQLSQTENQKKREVESVKAREEAETRKIQEEEKYKAESARIATEEQLAVAEENKLRQVVVARKNKERTEAIENERVEKDRMIEATERERLVSLAQIEKEKALEVEKKAIQNVIRERVMVEKTVIEEQERIKDTEAYAQADREKKVAITKAEKEAEESLLIDVKAAEASRKVAEFKAEEERNRVLKAAEASKGAAGMKAEQVVIEAEARQAAAEKDANAKKLLAEGEIAEKAAAGLAQVKINEAQTLLIEKKGAAEAKVIELKNEADAKGIELKGASEAKTQSMLFQAEAKGIESKANAMKLLDAVGREHEEYKIRLAMEKDIRIAEINIRKEIASYQAETLGAALKSARVDIVGGESMFFDRVVNAVSGGKAIDRLIEGSDVLKNVKDTFFNGDPEFFKSQLTQFFSQFGVSAEQFKDLTVSAALSRLVSQTDCDNARSDLYGLISMAERSGLGNKILGSLNLEDRGKKE